MKAKVSELHYYLAQPPMRSLVLRASISNGAQHVMMAHAEKSVANMI